MALSVSSEKFVGDSLLIESRQSVCLTADFQILRDEYNSAICGDFTMIRDGRAAGF